MQLCQAKIEYFGSPIPGEKDVLGLEIPMNDSLLVRRRQAIRDLDGVIERLAHWQWAMEQALAKRLAFQQFRYQVGARPACSDVVYREQVRMIERGGGQRFLLEAAQPIGIRGVCSRKNLESDAAS